MSLQACYTAGLLVTMITEKCAFTTKRGRRCANFAKHHGLCAVHYGIRQSQGTSRWEKAKQIGTTVGAIAGGATAIVKLVEEAVKFWSSLPFGPMPSESHYESLLERIGPFWPQMPDSYTPRTKGHPDWATAERLYDEANSVVERNPNGDAPDKVLDDFNEWFAELPDWYQEELAKRAERDFDLSAHRP